MGVVRSGNDPLVNRRTSRWTGPCQGSLDRSVTVSSGPVSRSRITRSVPISPCSTWTQGCPSGSGTSFWTLFSKRRDSRVSSPVESPAPPFQRISSDSTGDGTIVCGRVGRRPGLSTPLTPIHKSTPETWVLGHGSQDSFRVRSGRSNTHVSGVIRRT